MSEQALTNQFGGVEPAWSAPWLAPAKLNLFLHVLGRRADGLHELQTVFRFVDYGDSLQFARRNDGRIVLHTPLPGVAAGEDLTERAARALQEASGCTLGADIRIDKRLPMGGGLGGGSSDAATTLLALNALWGCRLDGQQLQALGLGLGADVPIFIHGAAALAGGVGEHFSPVSLPPAWYLILVPPLQVPTAQIFQAPDLVRNTPRIDPARWQPGEGHNDLQPVACRLYPQIAAHLDWLTRQTQRPARMSGSGACVFAEFCGTDGEAQARTLHAALPPSMSGFVARGVDSLQALRQA